MDKAKLKKCIFTASLGVLVLVGATAAFLTGSDMAQNWFTVAKVDEKIDESFDENRTLAAGEIINKQPWVTNTGDTNQLFFAEVYVPCMNATLLDSSGQRVLPEGAAGSGAEDYRQLMEVFNLIAEGNTKTYITKPVTEGGVITVNTELSYNAGSDTDEGWIYLGITGTKEISGENGFMDGTYKTYLFGYNAWVAPNDSTGAIFDKLQLRSIVDGDIDSGTLGQVTVRAHTIQAGELGLVGSLSGNGDTAPYTKADLQRLYGIITNKQTSGGN